MCNKMQYLNFDVDLIITNEYQKEITIPPFTLQIFIHNVKKFKLIQYLHKKIFKLTTNLTHWQNLYQP
jgi:hypothetical protein